jgi:aspartate racemase
MKKIGIIGGAGPAASALLYEKIIEACQHTYHCSDDSDFPEIIVISYPFSHMLSGQDARLYKTQIEQELQSCFDKLNAYGVDIIVIACNTLHTFLATIHKGTAQFLSLVDVTATQMHDLGLKTFLTLGTQQTINAGLYRFVDTLHGLAPTPAEQEAVSRIIDTILTGKHTHRDSITLADLICHHVNKFDGVVLACTELSVLAAKWPLELSAPLALRVKVIDPLSIVAQRLLEMVFHEEK